MGGVPNSLLLLDEMGSLVVIGCVVGGIFTCGVVDNVDGVME